jgi:hypothetical protein
MTLLSCPRSLWIRQSCAPSPAGRMAHRQRGRRSSLRLQQPIVWPDRVAVDPARSSGSVGSRQEEPGAGIAAASVMWLDHLLGTATWWSRPLDRWLVLQPGRWENLQYLRGTQIRRYDRGAHLFGRPDPGADQDAVPRATRTSNGWC